jgi:hypothetical protein
MRLLVSNPAERSSRRLLLPDLRRAPRPHRVDDTEMPHNQGILSCPSTEQGTGFRPNTRSGPACSSTTISLVEVAGAPRFAAILLDESARSAGIPATGQREPL